MQSVYRQNRCLSHRMSEARNLMTSERDFFSAETEQGVPFVILI